MSPNDPNHPFDYFDENPQDDPFEKVPKVWNKHHNNAPEDAVYVGRPSVWGNPFSIGDKDPAYPDKIMDRDDVVRKYKEMIENHGNNAAAAIKRQLKGKDLVCWCAPLACHADILLKIANDDPKAE